MKITKFRVNGQVAPVAESALEGQLLPPPSVEDAGKSVVVDEDGSYKLAKVGDVQPVIVTATFNDPDDDGHGEGTWTGASWDELTQAFLHGVAFVEQDEGRELIPLEIALLHNNNIDGLVFQNVDVTDTNVIGQRTVMLSDGSASYEITRFNK